MLRLGLVTLATLVYGRFATADADTKCTASSCELSGKSAGQSLLQSLRKSKKDQLTGADSSDLTRRDSDSEDDQFDQEPDDDVHDPECEVMTTRITCLADGCGWIGNKCEEDVDDPEDSDRECSSFETESGCRSEACKWENELCIEDGLPDPTGTLIAEALELQRLAEDASQERATMNDNNTQLAQASLIAKVVDVSDSSRWCSRRRVHRRRRDVHRRRAQCWACRRRGGSGGCSRRRRTVIPSEQLALATDCAGTASSLAVNSQDVGNFRCQSGKCIPLGNKCNGIKNCADNSDETGCAELDRHHQECWTRGGCQDDGNGICDWCGKHSGEAMYCCSKDWSSNYNVGHPCHQSAFSGAVLGHHCVTRALMCERCPVGLCDRQSSSAPCVSYGDGFHCQLGPTSTTQCPTTAIGGRTCWEWGGAKYYTMPASSPCATKDEKTASTTQASDAGDTWYTNNAAWSRNGQDAIGTWVSNIASDQWHSPNTHGPSNLLGGGSWVVSWGLLTDQWFVLDLGQNMKLSAIRVHAVHGPGNKAAPKNMKLQRGETLTGPWIDTTSFTGLENGIQEVSFEPTESTYWRLYVVDSWRSSGGFLNMDGFEIKGVPASVGEESTTEASRATATSARVTATTEESDSQDQTTEAPSTPAPPATMQAAPVGCFASFKKYHPLDMADQGRSSESTAEKCQQRCAAVSGCAHFSWWSDGGCHLQDSSASEASDCGATAGPRACGQASNTEGDFERLDKDDDQKLDSAEFKSAVDTGKIKVEAMTNSEKSAATTPAPTPAPASSVNLGLSQAQRDAILQKHNNLRRNMGASDMTKMSWDDTLAMAAQGWASGGGLLLAQDLQQDGEHVHVSSSCPRGHSGNRPFGVGENMAWSWSSNFQLTANTDFTDSVQRWYDEIKDSGPYKFGGVFEGFDKCTGSPCGHYTQVVWANADKLGCGAALCPHSTGMPGYILVCQYASKVPGGYGGNMGGATLFTLGSACSHCPAGYGQCSDGLCSS